VDADVLFAGSAAPSQSGASLVVLRLAEITLIDAVTSLQAVTEAERNLQQKLPHTLPTFRLLVSRCLRVVPDPAWPELEAHIGRADPKDLPTLVAAVQTQCPWLVTFNLSDFRPGHPAITVLKPGDFVLRVRELLTHLSSDI
jgi:predicted nucleic acid-binding protein